VKDDYPNDVYNMDDPEKHTFLLMDLQKEASIDLFYHIRSSLQMSISVHLAQ